MTLLAAASGSGAAPEVRLECRLEAPFPTCRAGQPVPLRFVLKNAAAEPVSVLNWHTPLEGLLADAIDVRRNGARLAYRGPKVKRGDPEADEYVRLPPGESASEDVDLAAAYDLSRPGTYEVRFPGPLFDVATGAQDVPRPRDAMRPFALSCGPVEIRIVR